MALFRRSEESRQGRTPDKAPTAPTQAYCRICGVIRKFSQCWVRLRPLRQCEACGAAFEDPVALYRKVQPRCPRCEELLEHPTFEYGTCDGCGSKYELVAGTPPSLLPNRQQRQEMDKHGRMRSQD